MFSIYRHEAVTDSPKKAGELLHRLQAKCMSLSELPERGYVPPELEPIGVFDYLEIHHGPYRLIYQLTGKAVFIHCILDGRRDMQELLQDRLLR